MIDMTEYLMIADRLRVLRPDRGNRYASRTVQTKAAGAYAQWEETVRTFAGLRPYDRQERAEFMEHVHGSGSVTP